MLIAVIVLQVLILLVLCVIARRLPKQTNVVNKLTVGDVASAEQLKQSLQRRFASNWAPGTPW